MPVKPQSVPGTLRPTGVNSIPNASIVSLGNAAGALLDLNSISETIGGLTGGGGTGGNVQIGATRTLTIGQASDTTYAGVISRKAAR